MPKTVAAKVERSGVPAGLAALGFVAVIAVLYIARPILIPLALALLFSFALTPVVTAFQKIHLGRAPAVLLVVALSFSALAGAGWLVTGQMVELASRLPKYKDNIHRKLEALQGSKTGILSTLSSSLQQIGDDLSFSEKPAKSLTATQTPVPVEVMEHPRNMLQYGREVVGPLLKPLETIAIVVIFTIFMMLERESLRNRLLRLVGQGQLSQATNALTDAAERVSRFLVLQALVNSGFGLLFAAGLWLIGVPNALLFGVMAGLLRFIPYVGTLCAAALPLALSLAVFDSWRPPLMVFVLFLLLELTVANFLEPWLYGSHTGISSLAILVAAVFWASLWGPVGLILSTPLTVCLVVIGRHVPHLQFLDIILGDEPVLLPAERYYQRLLALDVDESRKIVQEALANTPLVQVYDEIVVTALTMAEHDRYRSALPDTSLEFICQSTSEIVEEVGMSRKDSSPNKTSGRRILCFGAYDSADEITAAMLSQSAEDAGFVAMPFALNPSPVKILEEFSGGESDVVCICALPPLAVMHARSMAGEIRGRFPKVKILICLWVSNASQLERAEKLVGAKVVTTLAGAIEEFRLADSPASLPEIAPILPLAEDHLVSTS